MKIVSVETFPLFYRLSQPYGDANGYKEYRTVFLFRITTESGISGWGECTDWLPSLKLGFEKRIIPYLMGKEATDRRKIVQYIKKWHQRIAGGVDMALSEITAKYAGLSICDLWGGKWRETVPVYASFQSYTEQKDWIQHSANLVDQAIGQGFGQLKVKVGGRPFQQDLEHIMHIQDMLQGQCKLILDANQSYDLATARRWERTFSSWSNFLWFEEPLPMNEVIEYAQLRSSLSVAVAGGENLKSTAEFLPLLRAGAMDIIQPDIAHEDGIDGFRHTLQLSRDFGLRTSPHTFDGALSRLYTLFSHACLPPWSKMDGEDIEPVEWDVMDNPFTHLVPLTPVKGHVAIPRGVGIGVELDEEIMKKYLWDGSLYR
ncbi:mandelate racemase/muconate lactonizing enzyme family protein [Ammoniphilus resinae]|uniref:D-galactarolactone cycloisomerase n=1 Tax=Ammoniphilus resinae TaxID=861532 RepID=A0ABS4GLL7_9BACL|nr:mandelate racemase/muconate lactonizing enzyme family protein [Ammoniphilus resinae]MBP1931139.1 D-galactarolactone cycloisomerase [Ammoniphilus resinae]